MLPIPKNNASRGTKQCFFLYFISQNQLIISKNYFLKTEVLLNRLDVHHGDSLNGSMQSVSLNHGKSQPVSLN
jgi:hypothetical protein